MKKLAVLSTAALIGLGSMAATTEADAGWRGHRHHRGGAVAAGVIGGLAAGALIGAAASNAYANPSAHYGYGYAPATYGYAVPAYSYDEDDYEPAPVVYRTRVVHYAPAHRTRVVRTHYAPAHRTHVVRTHYAPAYRTHVVRARYAPDYGYAPAASYWGGPSVSVGFGGGWW
jgi:hypothetical protein